MPTYDYQCLKCGHRDSRVQTIAEYSRAPIRPQCPTHGEMDRRLSVTPGMSGIANALAGDRHYDGLRATDGTDISTRTKHRDYMKRNGLTMTDDFKQTWKASAEERTALRNGTFKDNELRSTLKEALHKSANPT